MKVDVLLGLQWGDEGKGKIVDVLTPKYDIIARFQGGPNAGHTLEFNGIKHVLHTIPSGIFRENTINLVGNGVVIDPVIFQNEISKLEEMGVNVSKNLIISKKAHLILPTHKILDAASEHAKGKDKIGSTLKGIGPTYMDKTGRNGIRVGDLISPDFDAKYQRLVAKHKHLLEGYDFEYNLDNLEGEWMTGIESLRKMNLVDSEQYIHEAMKAGKNILAEGAQGSLLDIDFGSYPFVTSSNTVAAGACTGLGVAPNRIGRVFGIFKAYCTRVGSGPFPTELFDADGEAMRKEGHEFGATTGRPRRCGWLDIPALKYACMINGVTELIMMKADVLSIFDAIKVCMAYDTPEGRMEHIPFDMNSVEINPDYVDRPGWKEDLTQTDNWDAFPLELKDYVDFVEKEVGIPISIVSVGPDRTQTIIRGELVAQ